MARDLLAFVSAREFAACPKSDAGSGIALQKSENPMGDFRDNFHQYLDQATPRNLSRQPNLNRAGTDRLPSTLLAKLRWQIKLKN